MSEDAMGVIHKHAKTRKGGIAYSGGKDSLVAQHLAMRCGITLGVTGTWGELDYGFWKKELLETVPAGIVVVDLPELTLDWLNRNPQFIFPLTGKDHHRFYALSHWKMLDDFYAEHDLGMWIMGRRTQDGNMCGRKGQFLIDSKKGGTLNPIRDWKHEHVFAYLEYNNIPLPKWYDLPYGFEDGPIVPIEENAGARASGASPVEHRREGLRRVAQKDESWVEPLREILDRHGML